ncbi:MAG TPA: universal stress protein [Prolixibacteraceae bacterium]|jgi:nucleotide-binding universal stress UspA family protein|nr:universal stress protein [Prolixibacteraceae bacterium]
MGTPPDSNFNIRTIKKVLIALDYDRSAQEVAQFGYSIAKAMKSEVILLHVLADIAYYSTPGYTPIMGFSDFSHTEFLQMVDEDGLKTAARHFLERIKNHLGDDMISTTVEEGEVADMVLKTALRSHVDIIVIGSHSRKWLEKILVGSTAEKVLGQTTIPLLIVPVKEEGVSI